ncbi:MAG: hypothetical protein H0X52_02435, partial [Gemmatimonadetes bacterium]|nr:hypothetical protein [Gemmatimonadota bacterium]
MPSDTSPGVHRAPLQGSLPSDPNQPFAASVGFRRVLGDDEVRDLLQQYSVRPYDVRLEMGEGATIHEVPAESASMAQIAAARRKAVVSARSANV